MGIDRSDPPDVPGDTPEEPGDTPEPRHAQSTPYESDAASRDRDPGVSDASSPDLSPTYSDSALRAERNIAYQAKVDAIYRQYAIDHGYARLEESERKIVPPAIHHIEIEESVGRDDRLKVKVKGRLVETGDQKKHAAPQTSADSTAVARGESAQTEHGNWIRNPHVPRQSGDHGAIPLTSDLVREYDLPEGYTSSPALKRDPYHPDLVAARSADSQARYAVTSRDRAMALGYDKRIPAQKAPFDSHGQEVFTNGKSYITPDVDGHNVTNGWKMFSRRGVRIGTYDSELNYVKE